MKKTVMILIIISFLSKFFGFFRELTLSYYYGTSSVSDAYIISLTIPTVIFAFVGAAFSTGFIPMYSKVQNEKSESGANQFTSNLVNVLLVAFLILSIFGLIFAPQLVKLFASGFKGETLDLAVKFTRISIFGIFFTGLVQLFSGYLQIKGKYSVTALIGFPLNICFLITIFLSSKNNLILLPIGIVIATASQFIMLLPYVLREGYHHKLIFDLKDKYLKKMFHISVPVILGAIVNDINILVDKTIASSIAVGGISALNYANRFNTLIQSIFVISISTVMYPAISDFAAKNNYNGLKKILGESLTLVSLLVMPATVGSMMFAKPIIVLLFGRGAFGQNAVIMTAHSLFFYSVGMLGIGYRQILTRGFYALQDTKTPVINSSIGMLINILLNIFLSRFMGISGLALATSIAAITTSSMLFLSFRKKLGPFGMKQISISFLKILFASLIMGGLAKLTFNYLTTTLSHNLSLLLSIGVGALSYVAIIYFMKIEDVDIIVGAIKKKLGRDAAK